MIKEKKCPFGIRARFCKYQRTYAKDAFSVMEGKLLFLCVLDKAGDCLELEKIVNEETRSLRQARTYHT
jgi:hypothetical protein